jgi:CRP-like cAMP-binding protein
MKTLDAVVAESPVFAGLDQPYLELIAGCASNVVFSAGDYLFREGDPADTFYLVRHGRVMLETFAPGRGALTIETIDDGEVIGWSWLFPPHRWHFDARALDLVRGVVFDAACLRGKIDTDKVFGYELLARFSPLMLERLQATRLQLLDVYGNGTR